MYRAQCPMVRSFVHRRLDSAVADDVVAEVFVAAWRRYDEAPTDPLPWLIGIARGILANYRRGHRRQSALYRRLASVEPRTELERAHGFGDGDSPVLQACAALSQGDQEVLLIVAWDGLDRTQAARAMGITTAQFAVRLHRARVRLRKALAEPPQPRTSNQRSATEAS